MGIHYLEKILTTSPDGRMIAWHSDLGKKYQLPDSRVPFWPVNVLGLSPVSLRTLFSKKI